MRATSRGAMGQTVSYGRPDHVPTGVSEVCDTCGVKSSQHRTRNLAVQSRDREYVSRYNKSHPRENPSERIIGIDGEGQGRLGSGGARHRYTYLAAADERGAKWHIGNTAGLNTVECLDFILDLPRRSLIFGYAFLYDLTKILQDLPDRALYLLFHDERRQKIVRGKDGKLSTRHIPVRWRDYRINYVNRRFSVQDVYSKRRATVWDIFRFYQGKFTKALIDWEIASKERLTDMERMKDLRASFDQLSQEAVHEYCDEECLYLSKLGRQLIKTHQDCGLELKHYYGAGSTASVLLDKMDVLRYRAPPLDEMKEAIASAFFGGRFENSCVGSVDGPVYNYDISSAYPYQAMLLPCLVCGQWEYTKDERKIRDSRLSLIHWTIGAIDQRQKAWGTLPVRAKDGTISFPLSCDGGWTWKDEFLAAQRFNPNVRHTEAWSYNTDCDHRPFHQLGSIYRERVRIGKEARGNVLKLGPNSVYGKVAQSRGGIEPPFQSWIWAGNITSGCRAQLLEGLISASEYGDPWSVLMFATDGIWSTERLQFAPPAETGTADLAKPLGGWEEKVFPAGVFAVRPGIYFPLSPTVDELKEVRARGLGKKVLYEQWPKIVEAFERGDTKVIVGGIERFIGAKTGISHGKKSGYSRSKYYGEWVSHPIQVTFNPEPKRETILSGGRLKPWHHKPHSVPYNRALLSPEAIALRLAEIIAEEQPNADFSEIE